MLCAGLLLMLMLLCLLGVCWLFVVDCSLLLVSVHCAVVVVVLLCVFGCSFVRLFVVLFLFCFIVVCLFAPAARSFVCLFG